MGVIAPQLFFGKVMHGRLFPKKNHFQYGIYYLSLPLKSLDNLPIARNRFAVLSFYDRDHGARDGSDLEKWARQILQGRGINEADGEITLMCMPRIFGYVFNPVSFWLCHDKEGTLRAVICEVHNTFGECHSYVCAHSDHRQILHDDVLRGEKVFHVSPFLEREGHYDFRFDCRDGKFGAWIDFYDAQGRKQLVTSLNGKREAMDSTSLRKAFWCYPLVTFKAIYLIHWQALKLVFKGIRYISKPVQKETRVSGAQGIPNDVTKM